MIREALKILAALLENCASAINERLDPPLPMVSLECAEEVMWLRLTTGSYQADAIRMLESLGYIPANDETITRH